MDILLVQRKQFGRAVITQINISIIVRIVVCAVPDASESRAQRT